MELNKDHNEASEEIDNEEKKHDVREDHFQCWTRFDSFDSICSIEIKTNEKTNNDSTNVTTCINLMNKAQN